MEALTTEQSKCYYDDEFLSAEEADNLLSVCRGLALNEHPTFKMFGSICTMHRSIGFYSDESTGYKFSGVTFKSSSLSAESKLMGILTQVNDMLGTDFNGILINYYKDGTDYISAHADDERELSKGGIVAAISLGTSRTFRIRRKVKGSKGSIVKDIRTQHGQLLVMEGNFQNEFTHEIPAETCYKDRFSLTFRKHTR